ncbi:MAG TPA: hypothetical protein VHP36_03325 [Chitinispirillaceae bacterium]|nr:hypothetical protein [Chitinispirillaceae bacterium]
MYIPCKKFLTIFLILLISCSPIKRFVRVNPDFGTIRSDIDTISVFSDALVAVDGRHDYYSVKASRAVDSLILLGTSHILSQKGYTIKTWKPSLMGSFMDTILKVPLMPENSMNVDTTVLPYLFPSQLTLEQLSAVKNISRKLYASVSFSEIARRNSLPLTSSIKSDLEEISNLINGNFALFIFHQAAVVNPDVWAAIGLGQLVLTGLISGGNVMAAVIKNSYFHTYSILVELSSGRIIWTNYDNSTAVRSDTTNNDPLYSFSKDNNSELTDFVKSSKIHSYISNGWAKFNFSHFPDRTTSKYFKGYSMFRKYPDQNLFYRLPNIAYHKINREKMIVIDSLVNVLSISEEIPIWKDTDQHTLPSNKLKKLKEIDSDIDSFDKYFQLAYHDRLKYRPGLNGKIKLTFTALPGGKNLNIQVVESTLNDAVMEYSIPYILKMINLPGANFRSKPVDVVHEISFGKL